MRNMAQFIGMRDQQRLTPDEIRYCLDVVEWFKSVLKIRSDVTLAPSDWPASNWDLKRPFYARVARLAYDHDFDRLRLWSSHFTGWPLYSFGAPDDPVTPASSAA